MKDRFEAKAGRGAAQEEKERPVEGERERGSPEMVRRGWGSEPTPESSPQQCSIGGTDDTSSDSTPESPSDLEFMYAFDHANSGLEVHCLAEPSTSSSRRERERKKAAAALPLAGVEQMTTGDALPSAVAKDDWRGRSGSCEVGESSEEMRANESRSSSEISTQPMILGRVGDWTARGRKASAVDRAGTPVPTGKAMARRQAKTESGRGVLGAGAGGSPAMASRGGGAGEEEVREPRRCYSTQVGSTTAARVEFEAFSPAGEVAAATPAKRTPAQLLPRCTPPYHAARLHETADEHSPPSSGQ
eukprot:CAMPEP_0115760390 /NCGR_PEP_ID=MMETSP0272-20121206/99970_1 /TAXON_ID=71861 /ORGANISM="Scrippsiella trochoidea, Strain CCMP3099" /LENGTH=302 /DNA_ID=CAMNT_0003206045 /DNA_START=11 /DNA_END=916 /DNA_ORIENTATION=-